MDRIERFRLHINRITMVEAGAFTHSTLSAIQLQHNLISAIENSTFAGLTALNRL